MDLVIQLQLHSSRIFPIEGHDFSAETHLAGRTGFCWIVSMETLHVSSNARTLVELLDLTPWKEFEWGST